MIFAAAAHFELHMPLLQVINSLFNCSFIQSLLQVAKRKWEAGKVSTEEFRLNKKIIHMFK